VGHVGRLYSPTFGLILTAGRPSRPFPDQLRSSMRKEKNAVTVHTPVFFFFTNRDGLPPSSCLRSSLDRGTELVRVIEILVDY